MVRKKVPWGLTYRDYINTLLCQALQNWLLGITGNTANPKFFGELGIGEGVSDNRTPLVAGCAEDSEQLGHVEGFLFVAFALGVVENVCYFYNLENISSVFIL